MNTTKRYGNEFKQRAIRLIETAQQDGKSEWAAIQSVSEKLELTTLIFSIKVSDQVATKTA